MSFPSPLIASALASPFRYEAARIDREIPISLIAKYYQLFLARHMI